MGEVGLLPALADFLVNDMQARPLGLNTFFGIFSSKMFRLKRFFFLKCFMKGFIPHAPLPKASPADLGALVLKLKPIGTWVLLVNVSESGPQNLLSPSQPNPNCFFSLKSSESFTVKFS